MQDPFQIWLPILVAAVAVFIASSLIHMLFKWHNADFRKLPNEDAVRAALRAGAATPGLYVVPHCADMKEIQGEEMQRKFREGPIGFVTLRKNGPPSMGGPLLQWFTFNLVVAMVAGDISLQLYGIGSNPVDVAQMVAILSFLTYAGGHVQARHLDGQAVARGDQGRARWPDLRGRQRAGVLVAVAGGARGEDLR